MKTTKELKESFFELQDKEATYETLVENLDDEKEEKPPHFMQAEKDLRDHFEQLYKELTNSESVTPTDKVHTPKRPFVLFEDEIKYNDGSTTFSVIKP